MLPSDIHRSFGLAPSGRGENGRAFVEEGGKRGLREVAELPSWARHQLSAKWGRRLGLNGPQTIALHPSPLSGWGGVRPIWL